MLNFLCYEYDNHDSWEPCNMPHDTVFNLYRLSSEAAALPTQQHEIARQNFLGDNLIPENSAVHPEYSINHNQQSLKYCTFLSFLSYSSIASYEPSLSSSSYGQRCIKSKAIPTCLFIIHQECSRERNASQWSTLGEGLLLRYPVTR
jgi:hypothetical protein